MSRFGGGHHWSGQKKGRVGQHPSLDVRLPQRGGQVRPRRSILTSGSETAKGPRRSMWRPKRNALYYRSSMAVSAQIGGANSIRFCWKGRRFALFQTDTLPTCPEGLRSLGLCPERNGATLLEQCLQRGWICFSSPAIWWQTL